MARSVVPGLRSILLWPGGKYVLRLALAPCSDAASRCAESGANRMSETQDRRMRIILLSLELISHGSTQAWNPSGGQSGEPDDKTVNQVIAHDQPPHLQWKAIYAIQATDLGREAVITDAKKELDSWTRRVAPRITGKTLEELILEDGEGWDPKIVAQRYGCDANFVRRKRLAAGRGTEDGKKLLPAPEPIDRAEKARELRARGASTRTIAETLGVTQSAVMKWIRKAAA